MVGGYRRLKVTWNDTNCLAIELPKKEVVAIRRTGISDWTGPWNVLDDRSQSQDASALVEKKISRAPNFPGGKNTRMTPTFGSVSAGRRTVPRAIGPFQPDSLCSIGWQWGLIRRDQTPIWLVLITIGRHTVWLPAACWVQLWGRGCVDTAGLIQAVFGCYCRRNWNERKQKKKKRVWTWWLQRRGTSASNRKHWRNLG